MPRISVSRNVQERKDRRTLQAIQETLHKFDHIQTLRQVESELLSKIYGNEAHRHKYRGFHESLDPIDRSR